MTPVLVDKQWLVSPRGRKNGFKWCHRYLSLPWRRQIKSLRCHWIHWLVGLSWLSCSQSFTICGAGTGYRWDGNQMDRPTFSQDVTLTNEDTVFMTLMLAREIPTRKKRFALHDHLQLFAEWSTCPSSLRSTRRHTYSVEQFLVASCKSLPESRSGAVTEENTPSIHGCVWTCCVLTQWFCWSLSLWKMAIIGNVPYFQTNPHWIEGLGEQEFTGRQYKMSMAATTGCWSWKTKIGTQATRDMALTIPNATILECISEIFGEDMIQRRWHEHV